jgi:aminoglycoside phosphotransferase (APT) family kinase protein
MGVRLPRVEWVTAEVHKEHEWLPRLASMLPLAIPQPLAMGAPAEGYPWVWSVYRWIEGADAITEPVADARGAATSLAEFVAALQRFDATGGPGPGPHNYFRGVPLAARGTVGSAPSSISVVRVSAIPRVTSSARGVS